MATENRTNSLIVPNKVDVNRPSNQGNMHLNIKVISMESILVANLNKMLVMLQTKNILEIIYSVFYSSTIFPKYTREISLKCLFLILIFH